MENYENHIKTKRSPTVFGSALVPANSSTPYSDATQVSKITIGIHTYILTYLCMYVCMFNQNKQFKIRQKLHFNTLHEKHFY